MNKRAKSNSIRIISGQWRGRRLPVLDAEGLRPTTDRVRETLFNWLMYEVNGANCLDLFAGSGALGFECLSRGALSVQFVESNAAAANNLSQNVRALVADSNDAKCEIAQTCALEFLSNKPSTKYDVVFLDPPFKSDLLAKVIALLVDNEWLNQEAFVYLEHDANHDVVAVPDDWVVYRQGKAGQSAYFLYTT